MILNFIKHGFIHIEGKVYKVDIEVYKGRS